MVTSTVEQDKTETPAAIQRIHGVRIHPEKLHAHPANPPTRSETENNLELIESIGQFGQREACRVRELEGIGQYELLSGHRRAAACRVLGIDVRCEIIECTDTEALREVMLGNAQRQDLDAIERAELLQTMIGAGMDREEAGKLFGLESESGIKNCLRLLQLPPSIRKLITDGTIPARAARYLVPYADATEFLDSLAKGFSDDGYELREFLESPDKFELLRFDNSNADARPMEGTYSPGWEYTDTERKFEPSAAERKRLKVATVNHNGKQIEIAQNTKLFDQLQKPHLVKKTGYGSPKSSSSATKAKTKKLTPKQQAAEDKRKAKEQAEQLKKRLPIWRRRFERMTLAIQTPADSPVILCTLAWWVHSSSQCETWIETAMETLGCKGPRAKYARADLVALLIGATDGTGRDVVDRLWRILVWPQQLAHWPIGPVHEAERVTAEPPKTLPVSCGWGGCDKDIEPQLKYAGVDLTQAWRAATFPGPEQMMFVELLQLHTTAQLDTLGKSWKVSLTDCSTKKQKVAAILAAHKKSKPLPMPKVLK